MSKFKDDPRITRIGYVLRATILDELPQIINVIKGDMSLIGPRPHPCYEVEQYKDWHKGRLIVLPGITGLWQINKWEYTSYDEAIQVDLDYVKNMSFSLDLKIFIKTVLLFFTPSAKL
jgi:lipopolysaccharide/colanic/teichoic acid biosynthesis glycosyltransferase